MGSIFDTSAKNMGKKHRWSIFKPMLHGQKRYLFGS
jgi:hypothetical protein